MQTLRSFLLLLLIPVTSISAEWTPDSDRQLVDDFTELLETLAERYEADPAFDVVGMHFRSMALVLQNHGVEDLGAVENLYARYVADYPGGLCHPDAYIRDGHPLCMAWVSPHDGAVSVATVSLPQDWTPDMQAPLLMELHGASGRDISTELKTLRYALRTEGIGEAAKRREALHVYPLNRGNSGYVAIGDVDLDECLAQVDRWFRTDPARQYLYGFSLGGNGTWLYGSHSRRQRGWAAVGIFSSRMRVHPFQPNRLAGLPVFFAYGEKEHGPEMDEMVAALEEQGCEVTLRVIAGEGHRYTKQEQNEMISFLLKQRNPDPVLPVRYRVPFLAHADDAVAFWVNGVPARFYPEVGRGILWLETGTNEVVARVHNVGWGAGLAFEATLPNGERIVSDRSWQATPVLLEDIDALSDEKCWRAPRDAGPVSEWKAIQNRSIEIDPSARVLDSPDALAWRTTFESGGGDAEIGISGFPGAYTIRLNDQEVAKFTVPSSESRGVHFVTTTTQPGANVLMVETEAMGDTAPRFKCGLMHRSPDGFLTVEGTDAGWEMALLPEESASGDPLPPAWWRVRHVNIARDSMADASLLALANTHYLSPAAIWFRVSLEVE